MFTPISNIKQDFTSSARECLSSLEQKINKDRDEAVSPIVESIALTGGIVVAATLIAVAVVSLTDSANAADAVKVAASAMDTEAFREACSIMANEVAKHAEGLLRPENIEQIEELITRDCINAAEQRITQAFTAVP